MKRFHIGLGLVALVLALLLPAGAFAATTSTPSVSYNTTLSDWNYGGFSYPYAGQLKLQIGSNGIINGWYSNSDSYIPVPVIGGQTGNYIWLDIGDMGRLHVNAHVQNGKFIGTATQGNKMFDFSASPIT